MNETYSDLREHTLNDIKQVIDFYRLEITDDPETHNTIEGSLAETIAEWVPLDFEQIEITSSSMGDDLIISVLYTNTSFAIDDQFIVVHNENDMFDNAGTQLSQMLESIDLSDFNWNYDYTMVSMDKLDEIIGFDFDQLEFKENDLDLEYTYEAPRISPFTYAMAELESMKDVVDDGIVRSKPFII